MVGKSQFLCVVLLLPGLLPGGLQSAEPRLIKSLSSVRGLMPRPGKTARFPLPVIESAGRSGHHVIYDADSKEVIRLVQVAGTLEFAKDRSTRLEVGLLTVVPSEDPTEDGFDCHAVPHAEPHAVHGTKPRPSLIVGRPEAPIPGNHTALIRLHYIEGMNKESCPAIVCCGGRMELHGEPMRLTWVKLKKEADVGANELTLMDSVADWKAGDHLVVTRTHSRPVVEEGVVTRPTITKSARSYWLAVATQPLGIRSSSSCR